MTVVVATGLVDWHALAPYAVLAGTAVVAALGLPAAGRSRAWLRSLPTAGSAAQVTSREVRAVGPALAALTAAAALFASLLAVGGDRRLFAGSFVVGLPAAAIGLAAALGGYALLLRMHRSRVAAPPRPEQVLGVVAAVLGLAGLAASRDVALSVIALELTLGGGALVTPDLRRSPRARRAQLAAAVALAVEVYAVGVVAVVGGSTRFARLARGAEAVAPALLALAAGARVAAWLWRLWTVTLADRSGGVRKRSSTWP